MTTAWHHELYEYHRSTSKLRAYVLQNLPGSTSSGWLDNLKSHCHLDRHA